MKETSTAWLKLEAMVSMGFCVSFVEKRSGLIKCLISDGEIEYSAADISPEAALDAAVEKRNAAARGNK